MLDVEDALGSRYSISQKRDLLIPDRRFCRLNLTEVVAAAKQHLIELDPESDFAVLPSWPKASYFPNKAKPFFSAFFKGIGEGVNRLEHLQIDWQIQQEGFVPRHRYVCKKTGNRVLVEMMFFNTKSNAQLNDIGSIFRECRPDVQLIVLCGDRVNGTSFTNENAQRQVNRAIKKAAKEGKNVMIIASRLGQRSFSIPSLSTVYLCYDNGGEAATRQKLARALTADTETKVGWIISCSFDPKTDDKLLPEQIATAKNLRKTKGGSFADNLKYVHRTDNILELTKNGLVIEDTDTWYNHAYDEGMITKVLGAMANPYLVKGKLREMMLGASGWAPNSSPPDADETGDTFNDKKPKKQKQQRDKTDEEVERDEISKFRAVLTMLYGLFPRMQIGTGKSQVIEILNDVQNNPDHASWFFKRISMPVEAVFLAIEDGVITEEDIEASLHTAQAQKCHAKRKVFGVTNGIPETVRFDVDLEPIAQTIVNEMKFQDWLGKYVVYDRAMGSGQLEAPIEKELIAMGLDPKNLVYGCEMHQMDVQYAVHMHNLKGTYIHTGDYMIPPRFDNISFLPDSNRTFKYIEIGNYPYNDGSVNDTVIWDKFIAQAKVSQADAVGVVVQASFLSQQYKGMSKAVKKNLIALGCYKIVVNDYSDFDETKAKVKTCIVFCRRGYQGLVEFVERKTGHSVNTVLDKPFDMIFDPVHRTFIDEMSAATKTKTERKPKWARLPAADKKKWCIGSYYRTEGFDKNPLKPFVILDPTSDQAKDHYVVFGKADTQVQAETLLKQLNSFWFSDPVQAFMLLTRYQISLDYTQYAKVPKTTVDHEFTNDELYTLWNISDSVKELVETLIKDCNHKKVKEKDNATDN